MRVDSERLPPESITVPARLRARLDDDTVSRLADSITKIGLQTPISVRWVDDDLVLVASRHRLEAAKRLGMEFVECLVLDGTEAECRMWEIAENLHRADLTALERSEHIAEWDSLVSVKLAETPKPKGGRPGSAAATSRELGVSESEVRRAKVTASLTPEAKQAARDTGRDDNRSALLQAAKQPPERQAEAIRTYEPVRSAVKLAPVPPNDSTARKLSVEITNAIVGATVSQAQRQVAAADAWLAAVREVASTPNEAVTSLPLTGGALTEAREAVANLREWIRRLETARLETARPSRSRGAR